MKTKNFILPVIIAFVAVIFPTSPANATQSKILPANSKIFITPMQNSLNEYIQAEIFRQKLPLEVVLKEKGSDYILTGSMVEKAGSEKWYHYLTGTAGTSDSAQGTISLIKRDGESVVWSTSKGDRSVFWGMLKKKGERKLAQRLVTDMKKIIIK
jgi:hypothetical protein